MAKTVSELAAERAKILEAIENKAKSMAEPNTQGHSLQDWLKAANEVVPETILPNAKGQNRDFANPASKAFSAFEEDGMRGMSAKSTPYKNTINDAYSPSDSVPNQGFNPTDFADDTLDSVTLSAQAKPEATQHRVNNKVEPVVNPYQSQYAAQPSRVSIPAPSNGRGFKMLGVAINLTLLLATLGIVGLGYQNMQQDLAQMNAQNEQDRAQIETLQTQLQQLPLSAEATLSYTAENQQKMQTLQAQLVELQAQLTQLQTQLKAQQSETASNQRLDAEKALGEKLEQVMQKLQFLESAQATLNKPTIKPFQTTVTVIQPEGAAAQIAEPNVPTVSEVAEPVLSVPSSLSSTISPPTTASVVPPVQKSAEILPPAKVKPVASISAPSVMDEPRIKPETAAKVAVKDRSSQGSQEIVWLQQQPKKHYVLQLASVPDKGSLEKMMRQKKLQNAHILPQVRNGEQGYILVTGSFSSQKEADVVAKKIKSELGITPWRRQMEDLSRRLPKA
ncbi:MAG: SPOR domain-containing protein [Thiotrichales bacterium]|nr:SPOR domain-containing protein [Thiotrichales bacterium]